MCIFISFILLRNKWYFFKMFFLDLNSLIFDVVYLVFKLLFWEFEDVFMKMWFCLFESLRSF